MNSIKLTTVGSSVGAVFPRELLAEMNLGKGDLLNVVKTPDGLLLTPYDPEFDQKMKFARKIMRKRRDALRELAK